MSSNNTTASAVRFPLALLATLALLALTAAVPNNIEKRCGDCPSPYCKACTPVVPFSESQQPYYNIPSQEYGVPSQQYTPYGTAPQLASEQSVPPQGDKSNQIPDQQPVSTVVQPNVLKRMLAATKRGLLFNFPTFGCGSCPTCDGCVQKAEPVVPEVAPIQHPSNIELNNDNDGKFLQK